MQQFGMIQVIFLLFAYLLCAVPFGVIVSRFVTGKDVRSQGSGNIGATNVARLMGKKWGLFVLFLDAFKAYVAVGLSKHVGPAWYCNLIAVVAVAAHCYPVYLKFKGGKGVATALGAMAALSWSITGLCVLVFAITLGIARRISVGSLTAALSVVVMTLLIPSDFMSITAVCLAALIWWKHQENIKRIIARTEPRFF